MLPQTNLQLYRLLHERGAAPETLAAIGAAYDAARQLFAGSYRANRKHFLCHLVGTAGALANWGESVEVIAAGLLHSAYLYGEFGDGKRGAAPSRRKWVASLVGEHAEGLIAAYTEASWNRPTGEIVAAARASRLARELAVIKLADVLDEVSDAGPAYCPQRPVGFRATAGDASEPALLDLANAIVGQAAVDDFRSAFELLAAWSPPACLKSSEKSFHVLKPGVSQLRRGVVGRGLSWAGRRLGFREAA